MPTHTKALCRAGKTLALAALATLIVTACGGDGGTDAPPPPSTPQFSAEVRRTAMGVPHILATDHAGLGYGMGHAQAEDALCTIADAMLSYRGERSRWFGADTLVTWRSTAGRARNLDSDFFHRHVLHAAAMDAFVQAQPAEVKALMNGFVAGYNRYLRELRAATGTNAHAACRNEAWVTPITVDDLYRRAYATNFAGGYANFLANIASAQPPTATPSSGPRVAQHLPKPSARQLRQIRQAFAALELEVGGSRGIGSNVYGLGADATGGAPMLLGNPHWYWRGPDRFYQAQLTIPGTLNVAGATFLGIPVILIGHNNDVAWSHTVSTARRFGFFQLTLAAGAPTTYVRDGTPVPMTAVPISVQVRDAAGALSTVSRTLYRTEYGPVVNLSTLNPALAWSASTAFALRDINADNFRTFRNWMRWARARTLDEFSTIQREEAAIPWVNTVAVARGSAQAWYADIGAMPNVPPQQLASCTTALGSAVAAALPNVPFLDGSRSACQWASDADSRQPGAIGASRMPSLLRSDYVANMNDSHWLTNPAAPLTGFPAIVGPAGTQAQSLRSRLGHILVADRLAGTDGYAGNRFTVDTLKRVALNSRALSAELFKAEALALVCCSPTIEVTGDTLTGASYSPARVVDVAPACSTLAAWDGSGNTDARGAHVWDEFWSRATRIPAAQLYSVPFNAQDPVHTPRGLNAATASTLRQAFGAAVAKVQDSGYAVNATRGDTLFATRNGTAIPLYGGCGGPGYFTINCSENRIEQGGYSMDANPNGNSYMQIVSFGGATVEAHTFLTFSLSDDPASPRHANYTQRYSAKQWVRMPFGEAEIAAHPDLSRKSLSE